ncbi:protein kinase domain-containing protein [Nannocystis punicea]|uniref:non-specific serine/threonine protein kinase n=1 Tax=Nannocystis punicea TaxID=2995304 RepID=A0ABY7HGN9_9BACT|nr:protein kinase [Nannocystis poenicansa]WAS98460.1 protein kinase [Nannocystis poenicansa]
MPVKRSIPASGTDALIGQTIGSHYTLQRVLERGPRAQAFLATHRTMHRTVVVQLASAAWPDGSPAAVRFDEQARALATLEHPNIAAVHDHGRETARVWVAVEYVEGETLAEYVRRMGRLQLEAFVPIAAQVLKGLGGAHVRRIVHGDLNADQVMLVEEQGRANYVKLLDLGIAALFETPEGSDEDAPVVGEPAYLAPEVIMNRPADARSDVYAVGVLFYHMLSGRLPFEGDSPRDVLHKHVNAKPTPLETVLPPSHGVPDELIHLVHDCLAKNPDNRPADANEIVERMIDCVPAAMFRLPVAAPRSRPAAKDNLSRGPGLSETEAAQDRARSATLAAAVEASGTHAIPAIEPTPSAVVHEPPSSGGSSGWIFALLAIVGVGVGVYFYLESQKQPPLPPPVAAPPQEAPPPQSAAGLAKAQEFEDAGKLQEALAAYEVVLVTDPTNAQAKERQAALKAMIQELEAKGQLPDTKVEAPPDTKVETPPDTKVEAPPETPPDTKVETPPDTKVETPPQPAGPVAIKVDATPKAEVLVDGVSKGKTPLTLELTPGPHQFEFKAKGFENYLETLEVAAEGQKELKAKLKRVDRKSFRDEENAASEELDPEEGVGTNIEITRPKKGG